MAQIQCMEDGRRYSLLVRAKRAYAKTRTFGGDSGSTVCVELVACQSGVWRGSCPVRASWTYHARAASVAGNSVNLAVSIGMGESQAVDSV